VRVSIWPRLSSGSGRQQHTASRTTSGSCGISKELLLWVVIGRMVIHVMVVITCCKMGRN
jgi:hypothetical protein